ncbi:glutamyl-tRNA reductase [Chitinispirillales bacterium ANBcel5]|uniref:glutamyl-tRNA reductase n=1 Tax=Cellulosispirillum alkaliphilum TaxID=3039283 RepID=UPI002A53C8BF|nr:glutamyl-tRNA reductase [Chitinispirillales bacterium ANBcel5]
MLFGVVGLNFRTAPIEIREKLSFGNDEICSALGLLRAKEEVLECFILSTCNRVEIYALLRESRLGLFEDFFRDFHKFEGNLSGIIYHKQNLEAVRHLCYVASGLDSMIIGESQIFGQIKDAYAKAQKCGTAGYAFDHLMAQVFSTVKKIRSKTKIGQSNVSVSYSAVKLAKGVFNEIENRCVLILGAGEMGELTVRNLISSGVSNVMVANRTFTRAVELADKFKGTAVMLHEIREYVPKADIVISSIATPDYVIKKTDVEEILKRRNREPLFIVDISVPRSIDPDCTNVEMCHLYNIDDLKAFSNTNLHLRNIESKKAKEIIESKIGDMYSYIQSHDIIPTMISIRTRAEEIRKTCIESMKLAEDQRSGVDSLTKNIVNKVLHHSESKFRDYTNTIRTSR